MAMVKDVNWASRVEFRSGYSGFWLSCFWGQVEFGFGSFLLRVISS